MVAIDCDCDLRQRSAIMTNSTTVRLEEVLFVRAKIDARSSLTYDVGTSLDLSKPKSNLLGATKTEVMGSSSSTAAVTLWHYYPRTMKGLSLALLLSTGVAVCRGFSTASLGGRSSAPLSNQPQPSSPRTATTSLYANNKSTAAQASSTAVPMDNNADRLPFPLVIFKFTRPHTLIGSAMAIPALHLLAAPSFAAAMAPNTWASMLYAMVPALLMNLYITGLNQITDVEIDKINKPNLVIPAGHLTVPQAWVTVLVALVASLVMGVAHPTLSTQGLNVALWLSGILGTLYSLPPFRLKRFPFLAAFCIVAVRGAGINAGFFAHAQAAAFGSANASVLQCLMTNSRCALSSLFFAVFGIVIALMKDVPDVVGDLTLNIRTFSVRLGQARVFKAMHRLLSATFWACGIAFGRAAIGASPWLATSRLVTAVSALWAGISVQRQAVGVKTDDSDEVYTFYMHLWKLFYLSYLVLPFAR